jgi:DNA-binding CsgD family transcriptional regulator
LIVCGRRKKMSDYQLNQKQKAAAQLLAIGNKNKSEIVDYIKISRSTLWKWENDSFFKAEVDRIKQEQEIFGTTLFRSAVIDAVRNIKEMANSSPNEMVRLRANQEILDRIYGKSSSNVNLTTEFDNTKNVDKDVLEAEFEEWEEKKD